MRYRPLGKTGIQLSEISLGGLVSVEAVLHYGIEKGVNLVHVAEDYLGGRSIVTLGAVLKTKRDKVYIALKDSFRDLDSALKTLNTDYVDFLMFNRHSATSATDARIAETFERYKRAGKVRFAGLTSHSEVKEATAAGIASGLYTIVMPALNQPSFEAMEAELRQAREKGIGVMPMKSMRGVSDPGLETAYLKKMLANPAITTVVKGIGSFEMFDRYLKAVNEPLALAEDRALYRYAQANRTRNCMMCGDCRQACPQGVDVPTILRVKDYYHDQLGDYATARSTWASIPAARTGSAACSDCSRCEQACPNGIRIVERLDAARRLFAG
jgi:predicted aldo/keto reductase-like oxidoreductase